MSPPSPVPGVMVTNADRCYGHPFPAARAIRPAPFGREATCHPEPVADARHVAAAPDLRRTGWELYDRLQSRLRAADAGLPLEAVRAVDDPGAAWHKAGGPVPGHPMNTPESAIDVARGLAAKGYIPVAMLPATKLPAERGWQEWSTRPVTEESIVRRWAGTRNGVAILCHGLVVLDVDDAGLLGEVLAKCGLKDAPICRTPRGGFHVHARARSGMTLGRKIRLHGQAVDLLTGPSLSILPPHENERGVPYAWVTAGLPPVDELPVARLAWTRERTRRRVVQSVEAAADAAVMVRRARAYIAHIEGAVSGQRGHDRTFRVACVLARKFRLTFDQAMPLFREWNEQCEPPWSERELEHKLTDALKTA